MKKLNRQDALKNIIEDNLFDQSFMVDLFGKDPDYDFEFNSEEGRKDHLIIQMKNVVAPSSFAWIAYTNFEKDIKDWAKKYDLDPYYDTIYLDLDTNNITIVFDIPSEEDSWDPEKYLNEEDKAKNGKKIPAPIGVGDFVRISDPEGPFNLYEGKVEGFWGEGKAKHAMVLLTAYPPGKDIESEGIVLSPGESQMIRLRHLLKIDGPGGKVVYKNNKVVISVSGGIAEVEEAPKDVDVFIVDKDNIDSGTPYKYNGVEYTRSEDAINAIKSDYLSGDKKFAIIFVDGGVAYYELANVTVYINDYDNASDGKNITSNEAENGMEIELRDKIESRISEDLKIPKPISEELFRAGLSGYSVGLEYASSIIKAENGKRIEKTQTQPQSQIQSDKTGYLNTYTTGIHLSEYKTDLPDGTIIGWDADMGEMAAYKGNVISVADLPKDVKTKKLSEDITKFDTKKLFMPYELALEIKQKGFKDEIEKALHKKYAVYLKDTGFDDTHIKLAMQRGESVNDIVDRIGKEYQLIPKSAAGSAVENKTSSLKSTETKSYICIVKDRSGKEIGSYPISNNDEDYVNAFLIAIGIKLKASDTKEVVEING